MTDHAKNVDVTFTLKMSGIDSLGDPHAYARDIYGEIIYDPAGDGLALVGGSCHWLLVEISGATVAPEEVCDAHSQEALLAYEAIESRRHWLQENLDVDEEILIYILMELQTHVMEQFANTDVANAARDLALRAFAGPSASSGGLVIMHVGDSEKDATDAKKLGFVRLAMSDYYVLNPAYQRPSYIGNPDKESMN